MDLVPDRRVSRRRFLGSAGALAAAIAAGGTLAGIRQVLAAKPGTAVRYPLYVPPVLYLPGSYDLTAAAMTVDIGGGRSSRVWAYNSTLPGPTFVAARGSTAQIRLINGLTQKTITHWHGMVVNYANDGHPREAIQPGGTYSYNFPVNQRAAMNWYHPHPHMLTGEQVAMGLAGAFLVRDTEESLLGLPAGAYEVPLVIRDATFDKQWNMLYKPRSGGFLGNVPMVNGTLSPRLNVDSAQYRFRILNGANSRIFGLALSTGASYTLIGNDGGLLETAVPVARIDLAPGERADVIVDFRDLGVGSSVILKDLRSGWDLLEFTATRTVTDPAGPWTTLSTISHLSGPLAIRDFSFDGMSKINGQEYDMNRIDFQVPFGRTELWRFTTHGNAPHPVHVHGAAFQIQSRTGGRAQVFPWERGWKDTVLLEDGETVEVLVRFDSYRGLYLLHCHKLEHEDMGMMANFEVI